MLASAVVVIFKMLSAMIQRGIMKALFLLVLASATQQATQKVEAAKAAATEVVDEAMKKGAEVMDNVKESASEAVDAVKEKAAEMTHEAPAPQIEKVAPPAPQPVPVENPHREQVHNVFLVILV